MDVLVMGFGEFAATIEDDIGDTLSHSILTPEMVVSVRQWPFLKWNEMIMFYVFVFLFKKSTPVK